MREREGESVCVCVCVADMSVFMCVRVYIHIFFSLDLFIQWRATKIEQRAQPKEWRENETTVLAL